MPEWRFPPWGMRGRLIGSFLLVILMTAGVIALFVRQTSFPRLDDIEILLSRRRAYQLAPFLAESYRRSNSWAEAQQLISQLSQPLPGGLTNDLDLRSLPWQPDLSHLLSPDRIVLVDSNGSVMIDSQGRLPAGQSLPVELQRYAVPIYSRDERLGQLVMTADFDPNLETMGQTALRRALFGAGLLAGSLALLTSLGLAQSLTRPMRNLSQAAKRLASSEIHTPLPLESSDEIGQMTAAFNEMAQALETQKQLRRQMVADIAHELRTPLSIMQLEIESLEDGLQKPAEAAASLRLEIKALERLIEDLRLLSLADAGGIQLERTEVELAGWLAQIVDSWYKQAQQQQVELVVDLAEALPPLQADPVRLAQVLYNLLNNALHYTPAGAKITLGGRPTGSELLLWVADEGPGIAPRDQPYLFERFYRPDRSRSRETGGSGLGLAIAKKLITLHGGRIWVESQPGQGSTFYLALPMNLKSGKI